MTIKEAQYFKKYIDGRLNDILGSMTQQQLNTLQGQRFAARFMGNIKGQQMLPQSVFRQFLNEIDFSEAKQLHDDLVKAQGQIEQALQQAEQVSDMESLHYTDVGGEETPFYIYIDMDDPELAGVSANDETALWQGIDRILQAKRTNNVQIVDLNINHRGLHECSYLYFSTSVVKSNRRVEHEYLWSAEGYYSRIVYQNGNTTDWEWKNTYADIAAAQATAEAAQATADNATQIANGKAAINHTHSRISLGSASVECVNGTSGDVPSPEIVLNGYMELCGTLQRLENYKRTRFEMPMTIEQILSKGKLLNEKVCEYLYNAIMLYYDNYDYEADGGSETLRMLSGENIYPIILSKYWHYGEKTAHAQHFKPWQVEFYDEIQSYDNSEKVVSIPVIRIHIGEDFAEWFSHFNPAGISDKVSYMEHRIGIDDIGNMPFSIYNASGTKLQEFTLI